MNGVDLVAARVSEDELLSVNVRATDLVAESVSLVVLESVLVKTLAPDF